MENGKASCEFFNRELSWIEFNARVLTEACRRDVPLLERLRFLGIVASNFDEFFMVRVATLKRQERSSPEWRDSSGMTAGEQLKAISKRTHELLKTQYECLNGEILPELAKAGLAYVPAAEYTQKQHQFLKNFFIEEVLPLLTPLRAAQGEEFPRVANLRLHAAFLLKAMFDKAQTERLPSFMQAASGERPLAVVQIPSGISRIVWLPSPDGRRAFTVLDDVIQAFGTYLFPGFTVERTLIFKATRDADFAVDEDRTEDFIQAMEEVLEQRQNSFIVRLVCNSAGGEIRDMLTERLQISAEDVYQTDGLLDLSTLAQIADSEGFAELKYPAWKHRKSARFAPETFWDMLKSGDALLHVPYESYEPVVNFVSQAAEDKDVLAIKITLYRTSGNSPIVHALEKAARKGKHVTAFVELKARFDEKRNISWAQQLEQAGVIVVYGIKNLKVHAKMLLVVRRESEGVHRYVHISTGNYNDKTARTYSDFSLFTSRPEIANDATVFFNMISGYSAIQTMRRLVMAPIDLKVRLLAMIERETEHAKSGASALIMAKMNSLGHEEIIRALYRASCAGVRVMLNVRGICMLVPGVAGMSENISVVSVIDRYLEHSRIFYFQNGGDEEMYLSSADWMPRNLDRRVELMFPVVQENLVKQLKGALKFYFADNCKSHTLLSDGSWRANTPQKGEPPLRAQQEFYAATKESAHTPSAENTLKFEVRRKRQ